MIKTWRWFGKNDSITLEMLRQIGVEGIVTALYDLPPGEVWQTEAINNLKQTIEHAGLVWSVAESLPVSEEIKYAAPSRDQLINNYCESLKNLGNAGIKTICYNFMPAIDWVRTDLHRQMSDGSSTLYFDRIRYAYFDCKILQRKGAENDYSEGDLKKIEQLALSLSQEDKDELIDTIIVKTQGFIHRKMKEGADPVTEFKKLLQKYEGIDRKALRDNLVYFLERVVPVAESHGIKLCIHPDDPPFPVFGLPRIVSREEDLEWILGAVNSPSNGITLCAGSLSAIAENDVPQLAHRFAKHIGFAHLRSTELLPDGDFMEASHLDGHGKLIEVIRELEKSVPEIPMRVDHGRVLPGDLAIHHNPGYTFYGRMFALAQVEGMMAVVRKEIEEKKDNN